MSGLPYTVPMAEFTQSQTLFELGLVVIFGGGAPDRPSPPAAIDPGVACPGVRCGRGRCA